MSGASQAKRMKFEASGEVTPPRPAPPTYEGIEALKAVAEQRWRENSDTLAAVKLNKTTVIETPEGAGLFLEHVASYVDNLVYDIRLEFIEGYQLIGFLDVLFMGLRTLVPEDSVASSICDELRIWSTMALDRYISNFPWMDHGPMLSPDAVRHLDLSLETTGSVNFTLLAQTLGRWKSGVLCVGTLSTEHNRLAKRLSGEFARILDGELTMLHFYVYRSLVKPIVSRVQSSLSGQKKKYTELVNKLDEFLNDVTESEWEVNHQFSSTAERRAKQVYLAATAKIKRSPTDISTRLSAKHDDDIRGVFYMERLNGLMARAAASVTNDQSTFIAALRNAATAVGEMAEWLPPQK